MAQPQENINGIVAAFYVCARSDGDCGALSREELRQLIQQEFVDAMENPQDPKTVKKVLHFLEDGSNRRVDFSELLSLVFRMAKACYKPLQQHQVQEGGQELTVQEEAGGEQLLGPHTAGRVSHNQQIPEQGVNSQVQDTEMLDPDNHQTQEGETPEQDLATCQTQEGETSKQDLDTHQTQEGETPEQDLTTHQTQEGETSKKDLDTHQTQEGESPEQDQHTHQDDGTEAAEGDPERGEILDTATLEQDRNTHKAEEAETPKQDPKMQQAQETEAPGQGSNHHQSPEAESAEQDLNFPSETQGKDPNNKTQVFKALQQDPNPGKTQKLLPPQQGERSHWDPKPQGMCHDPACHQVPESEVLEQERSWAEAPFCPAQQQQEAHHQIQPAIEQQLLQSLYQWPPQQ
ncbi:cornulin [Falco peregrinus]|uniref:cornulin n=1 Tax=Falco peregrinus TaxID=8954 RepID=UPI00247A0925|nr:cornulin [Falco peregrinus]